jgi:dihydroorotase (EC 3.5.2.3)
VFNAPTSLPAYATVFEELNALEHFEAFCSENGPNFYGLPLNEGTLTLVVSHGQCRTPSTWPMTRWCRSWQVRR